MNDIDKNNEQYWFFLNCSHGSERNNVNEHHHNIHNEQKRLNNRLHNNIRFICDFLVVEKRPHWTSKSTIVILVMYNNNNRLWNNIGFTPWPYSLCLDPVEIFPQQELLQNSAIHRSKAELPFLHLLSVPHRWHLLLSPLYDVSGHTNHIFSVRIWSWQHVSVNIFCCWVEPSLLLSSCFLTQNLWVSPPPIPPSPPAGPAVSFHLQQIFLNEGVLIWFTAC